MMLMLKKTTPLSTAESMLQKLSWMGFTVKMVNLGERIGLAIVNGIDSNVNINQFKAFDCFEEILPLDKPYKLASRGLRSERTVIKIGSNVIGDTSIAVMAGPCSIESESQIDELAGLLAKSGAQF